MKTITVADIKKCFDALLLNFIELRKESVT